MEEHQAAASVPPPAAQASAGLADNVAGALAYVTVLPAILFLVLEPYNKRPFVRFNALQSLGIAICGFVGSIVCGVIPILGWFILMPLLMLTLVISLILCAVKAYGGTKFKLPVLGNFVENLANK
jgi:uncharacterized membrane protein